MVDTTEDTGRSEVESNTNHRTVTDGGNVGGQTGGEKTESMLGETWEKLAVGSGVIAIVSVLFLPVLSLNVPESLSEVVQLAGVGESITLGDAQNLVSSLAQLSAMGDGDSTAQRLTTAATILNVTFYAIIVGGGLLIIGGVKKRVIAAAGGIIQTLPVLGLTYAVFVLIPNVIEEQLGTGTLAASIEIAANQLVGPGVGLYLLLAASVGGIGSVLLAYQ